MTTAITVHGAIALDGTLGAAFLGHFVTSILYGITSLQAYLYYRDQTKDSCTLRYSVLALWILDGLHCGLITAALYGYCVTNFMNLGAVQKPVWHISAMIIVSNFSNSVVRAVFSYRIYKLGNGSWIIPIVLLVMSVYIVVDATVFAVELTHVQSYVDVQEFSVGFLPIIFLWVWSLYAGLSVEAMADLVIAITQVLLYRSLRTGIRSTDSILHVLMTYSVNTGLLTSICAICAVIAYAIVPNKFVHFAFYFVLSKLYVNSLLATLNARGSLLGSYQGKVHVMKASPADRNRNQAIEFTTITSADITSSKNIVETAGVDEESRPS